MHLILFLLFAGFCLAGAINLLLQSHPINSTLSLIVVMTSLAVLYLLLGAEFLAAAQVIVYAGAIMVLFTFVVMLLNAGREERTLGSRTARAVGFPAVVAILGVIATAILNARGLGVAALSDGITSTEDLSRVLFHELLLPFEVTSVLILIAIAVSWLTDGGKWLIVAVILTTWYSLAPGSLSWPSALEISAGRGQLIHIGTAWGADSLWAALFIFIPAAVFGIYLVTGLLRSQ